MDINWQQVGIFLRKYT